MRTCIAVLRGMRSLAGWAFTKPVPSDVSRPPARWGKHRLNHWIGRSAASEEAPMALPATRGKHPPDHWAR